jgi:CRP-like cAMP-binding protein
MKLECCNAFLVLWYWPAKLKLLAFTSIDVNYNAGQILFRQGDEQTPPTSSFSGKADILVSPTADDKVAELLPNSIVGEIAIFRNAPAPPPSARSAGGRDPKGSFLRLMKVPEDHRDIAFLPIG